MSCLSVTFNELGKHPKVQCKHISENIVCEATYAGQHLNAVVTLIGQGLDVATQMLNIKIDPTVGIVCTANPVFIRSCFGSGKWFGSKPWLGKETWKSN